MALGAQLSYILVNSGKYSRRFSNGLVTASGSIGLLFPPSLPVILYGIRAQVPIDRLFLAGILPMFLGYCLLGTILFGDRTDFFGLRRSRFNPVRRPAA